MAKGLRASVKKNNRTKLRSRVFAPVEDARTARLSAKLLELAQQSKPAKTEMDLEPVKETTSDQQSSVEEPQQAEEGVSYGISCPIPASFSDSEGGSEGDDERPSHPRAESLSPSSGDSMFYHLLGLSNDVVGFGWSGRLLMQFDHNQS